jgi:RNA recognition motif-containing protein
MAKNLFIGNLSYSTTENKLKEAFAKFSPSSVRIMDGRGFGFVEVGDDQAASAISEMNETDLDGRKLIVNEARPREERPKSYGGGNGGGGGYGSGNRKSGGRGGRW